MSVVDARTSRQQGTEVTLRRAVVWGVLTALIACITSVVAPSPVAAETKGTKVMGLAVVSAEDLAGWFKSTGRTSLATVEIEELARYYIEEGSAEGVAGDIAFAQSIVETGYFTFSARVLPEFNNFSGLGAVDSGDSAEKFPDARTGVRAQIQHLRAYAEPGVTASDLSNPLVDTRFDLVKPKGKAPVWEQYGGGVWASDPDYAGKVLRMRLAIMQWARRYGTSRYAPFSTAQRFAQQGFRDVLFREGTSGEIVLWQTAMDSRAVTPEVFIAELLRGEGAGTVQQVTRLYFSTLGRLPDRSGLAYWTNRRKNGVPLDTLAAQIIGSPEFELRFGAPDDDGFITLLYKNVLDRTPDEPGLAFWNERLAAGSQTRRGLVLFFSESFENRQRTTYRVESSVLSLGLFEVPPSLDELDSWRSMRADGATTEDLALSMLIDARFLGRF